MFFSWLRHGATFRWRGLFSRPRRLPRRWRLGVEPLEDRTLLAAIVFVDVNNQTGIADGSASKPFTSIQAAVTAAQTDDIIKVAQGTYSENVVFPDRSVQLQGGFAGGTESAYANGQSGDFAIANPTANVTKIVAVIDEPVLRLENIAAKTIGIDGFTLTGGHNGIYCLGDYQQFANVTITRNVIENNGPAELQTSDGSRVTFGGGIYAVNATITVTNNVIRNNNANRGGGLYIGSASDFTITDNTIENNSGYDDHGGGVVLVPLPVTAVGTGTFSRNLIRGNVASKAYTYGWGGGMLIPGLPADPAAAKPVTLSHNVWTGNFAPSLGGALFVDDGAKAVLDHELIYGNSTNSSGGAIFLEGSGGSDLLTNNDVGSFMTIMNSTIADNHSTTEVGNGVFVDEFSRLTVVNSIFWDNTDDLFKDDTSTIAVTYTDLQEAWPGTGNLSADPLFANAAAGDYHLKSLGGRFDPAAQSGAGGFVLDDVLSPAIDAGNPASAFANETAPNGGRVNLGFDGNTAQASRSAVVITVSVAPGDVTEDGAPNLIYNFTRSGITNSALTVDFTVGGTATLSTDYAQTGAATFLATAGTLKFAAGETAKSIKVDPKADTTIEASETVILTVTPKAAYFVGAANSATGTITNDDFPMVTLAVTPVSILENGTPNAVYTFTRSGSTTDPLTVNFTVGGTATIDSDYSTNGAASFSETTGSVTFTAGQSTATVTLDPTSDTLVEANETVILSVVSGSDYVAGTAKSATATITNDDTEVSVSVSPGSVSEDGTPNLIYTFTRAGVTAGALTANFTVSGTATLATDYVQTGAATFTATTGTVSFSNGQTTKIVTVNPTADAIIELDETVIVTLTPAAGYLIGASSFATGTIANDDPRVTIAVTPASVVENGTANATYTFTRTGSTANELTINFAVGGTATFNTDYTVVGAASFSETAGTLTFAAGQATKTLMIDPTGDTDVEPDETVILTVAAGSDYAVGTPTAATATITSDDSSFSVVPLNASRGEGNTGMTPFTFTVTRNGGTLGKASVNFVVSASDVNPVQISDFGTVFPTGVVSFAAGQTTKPITINVKGDTAIEADEGFVVTLLNPIGGSLDATTAAGTILSDDATVSIAALSAINPEGNNGSTPFTFTVTRSPAINLASTVSYKVTGAGTGANAANAADFGTAFPSGTVMFAPGETTQSLTINALGDTTIENNEGFTVTLSAPTGTAIGTATAIGTIQNDDASLSIAATSANKAEGTGTTTPFVFTVTRTGDLSVTSTVDYEVTVGGPNAANAADFGGSLPNGSINFAVGQATQIITVEVQGDEITESNEVFSVRLFNANGALIGTATALGTIQNDEANLSIAATSANKVEGNSGNTAFTFTVTRTGILTGTSSVMYAVVGNGDVPADEEDFGGIFPTGTISFATGKASMPITINVVGDLDVEDHEGFTVMLFTPVGATLSPGHTEAQGTIKNDDVLFSIESGDTAFSEEGTFAASADFFTFSFFVTRFGPISGSVSVRLTTSGFNDPETENDPASSADFSVGFGSVTITFNTNGEFEETKEFALLVRGDSTVENDEDFLVTLNTPTGGRIDPEMSKAMGTIFNDDFADEEPPPDEEFLLAAAPRFAANMPEKPVIIVAAVVSRSPILDDPEGSEIPISAPDFGTLPGDDHQDPIAIGQTKEDDVVANAVLSSNLATLLSALP